MYLILYYKCIDKENSCIIKMVNNNFLPLKILVAFASLIFALLHIKRVGCVVNFENSTIMSPNSATMLTNIAQTTTLATVILPTTQLPVSNVLLSTTPIHHETTFSASTNSVTFPEPSNLLYTSDLKYLSELPMETLLKIKRHLEEMTRTFSNKGEESVQYNVYEEPQEGLSEGYETKSGKSPNSNFHVVPENIEEGGFYPNSMTSIEDVPQVYDHGKTLEPYGGGIGFITPQPFIHHFKK